jgi:hypothetical protein
LSLSPSTFFMKFYFFKSDHTLQNSKCTKEYGVKSFPITFMLPLYSPYDEKKKTKVKTKPLPCTSRYRHRRKGLKYQLPMPYSQSPKCCIKYTHTFEIYVYCFMFKMWFSFLFLSGSPGNRCITFSLFIHQLNLI